MVSLNQVFGAALILNLYIPLVFAQTNRQMELLVTDSVNGEPLAKTKIVVNSNGVETSLTTDSAGHASIPCPEFSTGYFGVTVERDDYVKKLLRWSANPDSSLPTEYALKLEKGITISGKVTDDAGAPIDGATVVLSIRNDANNLDDSVERNFVSFESIKSSDGGVWSFSGAPKDFEKVEVAVWDYGYASGEHFQFREFTSNQARDGSISLVLARGVPIEGVVYGSNGKPLKGARVMYGGQMASNKMDPQLTDNEGKFRYAANLGEKVVLTVTAKGHSPELAAFTMGDEIETPSISLEESKSMFGRIVGPNEEPVPFAWVYIDTWRGTRSLETRIQADKDGKFRWEDAPTDVVKCDIDGTAAGFVRETVNLTSSEEELVISVRKALHVTGTVLDENTKQPINDFQVIRGFLFAVGQPPYWDRSNDGPSSHDGMFEYFENWPRAGYAVRIEADGYLPYEGSGFSLADEDVVLEIELTKAENIELIVKKSNGEPAKNAKAYLLASTSRDSLTIYNGRVNNRTCAEATTNGVGKLKFPPQLAEYLIVVYCEDGYAETDSKSLADNNEVTLEDWGKLEVHVSVEEKPAAGVPIKFTQFRADSRVYIQFDVKTELNGSFKFERVPTGNATVSLSAETHMVLITAGETTTATFGDEDE